MEPGTRRLVMKWTVGLTVSLGLAALWSANGQRAEYFLRKRVMEHPQDSGAWIQLAWHYKDEGDDMEGDSGDEDHAPQDPTMSYREALECLNRAVSLGADGFNVQFARAELADALGQKQDAASFGRKALDLALNSADISPTERDDQIKRLREMAARNVSSGPQKDAPENTRVKVRNRRRDGLPSILRWPFQFF